MILLYREAASIIQRISEKKGTVKNLVLNSNYKNKKQLQALVCEALKYQIVLQKIIENTNLQKREKVFRDSFLALVVTYEFLFGRGFQRDSPYKQAIDKHKAALNAELARLKIQAKATLNSDLLSSTTNSNNVPLPRYARVNTLKASVKEVIGYLCRDDFSHITVSSSSYPKFLESVSNLKPGQFFQDPHIPELLVFAAGTDLHDNSYYKSGHLILQDKASCVPAFALNPAPGSHVIDCCAAPGNKTSHLAAIMKNKGKVFAFDRDVRRFSTLNTLSIRAGASCIDSELKDFLSVKPTNPKYKDVKYILVDPSCSGSGIVGRIDEYIEGDAGRKDEQRLEKLSNFQSKILKHALSFPSVERVVYSTCSIHKQENEGVVQDVLSQVEDDFDLENVLPIFPQRGQGDYERCLRLSPQDDMTQGFFVSCFVRREEKLKKVEVMKSTETTKNKEDTINGEEETEKEILEEEKKPMKSRKRKKEEMTALEVEDKKVKETTENQKDSRADKEVDLGEEVPKKNMQKEGKSMKNKKRKKGEVSQPAKNKEEANSVITHVMSPSSNQSKKKKKKSRVNKRRPVTA